MRKGNSGATAPGLWQGYARGNLFPQYYQMVYVMPPNLKNLLSVDKRVIY
jgi:hypothetical protein